MPPGKVGVLTAELLKGRTTPSSGPPNAKNSGRATSCRNRTIFFAGGYFKIFDILGVHAGHKILIEALRIVVCDPAMAGFPAR
jgi:hypothetical protein